jgi:hypothetical protein
VAVIRNFGHYWDRKIVNWGERGRGKNGSLDGFLLKSSVDAEGITKRKGTKNWHPTVIDFSDQSGIYALMDKDRDIVYVGQAGKSNSFLRSRLRDHTRDDLKDRWSHFSWFGYFPVENDIVIRPTLEDNAQIKIGDVLNQIEGVLMQLIEPRLNKRGPNWKDVNEYIQYDATDWGAAQYEPLDDDLYEIWKKMLSIEKKISEAG